MISFTTEPLIDKEIIEYIKQRLIEHKEDNSDDFEYYINTFNGITIISGFSKSKGSGFNEWPSIDIQNKVNTIWIDEDNDHGFTY